MPHAGAEKLKGEGNTLFKNGQYAAAVEKYKQACQLDASIPAYWSNLAACYEKLQQYEEMADASRNCIKSDRSFVKGYFRLATAQHKLKDLDGAIKTLESGLAVQSSNADLKQMKKVVQEELRVAQVQTYCRKVEELMQNGDVAGAYKTLDLAQRLDAQSPAVQKLVKVVTPKYEALEKKRKAGLSGPELYKEKGDDLYKNAQFENAVAEYTKCIDLLKKQGKDTGELALKAYSNRAACNKQISHFDAVIEDCTAVLEIEPDNVKALVRRAQAFEGVERYRFALQDVKTVLSMPFHKVGKQNLDLCNGMQHRLTRTVNQLKQMNSS